VCDALRLDGGAGGRYHDPPMRSLLRLLYRLYSVLVFAPVVGLATVLLGFATVPLVFVLRPRQVSWLTGRTWARVIALFTPMWVTVVGREHVDPSRSYVIVANHQSQYDIITLYGWLDIDFKWVMKQELRKIFALGVACERLGHIFIDRSDRQAALASIEAAKARLEPGSSVLFFAEGTRSRDGRLGPFKKGAFRFALDTGLPILPLTTLGTPAILPPRTLRLRPGRARLVIHPPVEVGGLTEGDLPALIERVRGVVASVLPPEAQPLA
jgi:1-acyl-sn-glycerol-3-phosphate acyltransferase